MSKKTPPRCDINNVSRMVQPSPTVNTKEALDMVKEMWGKSRRETGTNNSIFLKLYRIVYNKIAVE